MRKLADVFGVNIHGFQHLDTALALGFRHFRADMLWCICNPAPGVWNFAWADGPMAKIRNAGGGVLLCLYATPHWKDETVDHIPGWSPPAAIPVMKSEWIPDWQEFLVHVAARWPWAEANIATETTLHPLWASRDPQQYLDMVVRPASEVMRPRGLRVIAPGTTMQGERAITWREAMRHFRLIAERGIEDIDALDVHVYRQSGAETVSDLRRVLAQAGENDDPVTAEEIDAAAALLNPPLKLAGNTPLAGPVERLEESAYALIPGKMTWWAGKPLYCSETGFSARDEVQQLADVAILLSALETDPLLEVYERVYYYSLWGNTSSILRADGTPTLAAQEISRRLLKA